MIDKYSKHPTPNDQKVRFTLKHNTQNQLTSDKRQDSVRRLLIFTMVVVAIFSVLLSATVSCTKNSTPVHNKFNSKTKTSEEWFGIYLKGKRVGYSFSRIIPSDSGFAIEEINEYTLRMMGEQRTLSAHLYAHTDSSYLLTDFTVELKTTGHVTKVEGIIKGLSLTLTSYSQGVSTSQTIPLTEKLYLPDVVEEIIKKRKLRQGDELTFTCFDPATQFMATMTAKVIGREKVEVTGKQITGLRIETSFSGLKTILWYDDDYKLIKKFAPDLMGLEMIPLSRKNALATIESTETFDLLSFAAVNVTGVMSYPQKLSHLQLELSNISPENLDLSDDYQKVNQKIPLILEFILPNLRELTSYVVPSYEQKRYLESSIYIQSDNSEIKAVADSIAGKETDAIQIIAKLVSGVFYMLKKNPTASLPSAIDVLKTREGDCNEHSILFTALARAKGIPTKIYAGLVTFDGHAYYYHAWCAVWFGKWVPVDPTFNQFPADLGHLKLIEGEISEWPRVYKVVSKLKIKVLNYDEK
jgi:hypothetical protein